MLRLKVAVMFLGADRVTVQIPVPEQSPLQPAKVLPVAEVAVNTTGVLLEKLDEQVEPQLMPEGELVTVPLPVPDFPTVRIALKIAVTLLLDVMMTVQLPVPEQSPLQLPKL
ncbi:hypothetical protein CCP4SC76_4960002 [Gammaproteobacteria bacterium]